MRRVVQASARGAHLSHRRSARRPRSPRTATTMVREESDDDRGCRPAHTRNTLLGEPDRARPAYDTGVLRRPVRLGVRARPGPAGPLRPRADRRERGRGHRTAAARPAPAGRLDDIPGHRRRRRDGGDDPLLRGTVGVGPLDAAEAGRMAIVSDPSGAVFGIWQAAAHIGTALAGLPEPRSGTSW